MNIEAVYATKNPASNTYSVHGIHEEGETD